MQCCLVSIRRDRTFRFPEHERKLRRIIFCLIVFEMVERTNVEVVLDPI